MTEPTKRGGPRDGAGRKQKLKTMTNAERQRDLRARRLSDGLTEVRGIYAKQEDHAKIKAYAKNLAKLTNKC